MNPQIPDPDCLILVVFGLVLCTSGPKRKIADNTKKEFISDSPRPYLAFQPGILSTFQPRFSNVLPQGFKQGFKQGFMLLGGLKYAFSSTPHTTLRPFVDGRSSSYRTEL